MHVASYLPLCYNLIRINWECEKMLSAIYPVPASEVRLPFYLLGIGRTSPEFHVKRDKGLISLKRTPLCIFRPNCLTSIILKMMNGIPAG